MRKKILHLGAGKLQIDDGNITDDDCQHFYIDQSYSDGCNILLMEENYSDDLIRHVYCSCDIFKFLDTFKFKFDHIYAERICEHMFYDDGSIGRFLNACFHSAFCKSRMTIVVPDAEKLSNELLQLPEMEHEWTASEMNSEILLLNTEFCNSRCDPHGSIWTKFLAKHYIDSEDGWKIKNIETNYEHMGRDIYMKIELVKSF